MPVVKTGYEEFSDVVLRIIGRRTEKPHSFRTSRRPHDALGVFSINARYLHTDAY